MSTLETFDYIGTLNAPYITIVQDVSQFKALRGLFISNTGSTITLRWSTDKGVNTDFTDVINQAAGVSQSVSYAIKAKYLSISYVPLAYPSTTRNGVLFFLAGPDITDLKNVGAGAKIYRQTDHAVRSVTTGTPAALQVTETSDTVNINVVLATGPTGPTGPIGPTGPTGPIGPASLTAVNNDVQINNLGGNSYSVGVGNGATGLNSLRINLSNTYMDNGDRTVALGYKCGDGLQKSYAIAIGSNAGESNQGTHCIGIGYAAGQANQGGATGYSIAIGYFAGITNQGNQAIALGSGAATTNQPNYSIAFGSNCAVPGAVGRLAFGSSMEAPTSTSDSTFSLPSSLLNLEWNGTLYRIPLFSSTTTQPYLRRKPDIGVADNNAAWVQNVAVANTFYDFSCTPSLTLGINFALSSSGLQYTGTPTKYFMVTLRFMSKNANQNLCVLRKNGSDITNSTTAFSQYQNIRHTTVCDPYVVELATNDIIIPAYTSTVIGNYDCQYYSLLITEI